MTSLDNVQRKRTRYNDMIDSGFGLPQNLATKAGNGTLSDQEESICDRYIQKSMQQLQKFYQEEKACCDKRHSTDNKYGRTYEITNSGHISQRSR